MAGKLNDRQQLFVEEYLVDRNATQAAIRAGYSKKAAKQIGSRLLTNEDVATEIQARRAVVSEKLEITQERVLQELAAIGFARMPNYATVTTEPAEKLGIHPITGEVTLLPAGWDQYVKVIDTAALSDIQGAAIASIKQGAHGIEVKLHDKARALEMLGKHLGIFDTNAAAPTREDNNLFDAIMGNAEEDLDTDEIPELEQASAAGDDVVEASEV
ncbi:terminase small subunit [Eubacteriales bacterium OttesenSCG-928-A19]|nr:terminase small subunit [Eubacteriales bacterium OttesenSCG-928-A19]